MEFKKTTKETRTLGTVRNRIKFAWFPVRITGTNIFVWLEYYRQHQEWSDKAKVFRSHITGRKVYLKGWLKTNCLIPNKNERT